MKLVSASPTLVEVVPEVDKHLIIKQKTLDNTGREDFDDGFYVCDLGDVVAKHRGWKTLFSRVRPHYAIKCNPDETLLKMLVAMGTGFDCASKSEIRQMLSLGAQAEDIIFANPCKQKSHIRYARDNNVKLIVFDNENELIKLKEHYPNAELVLRIQTDDSSSVCRFSMKYGAHIDSCRDLLDTAYKMGLYVTGISFHVGSGCQDVNAFVKALENARSLFDYAETIGYHFTLLDIGGGFPGIEDVKLKFEEITSVVNYQLEKLFPLDEFADMRVIGEPGRYYAASAFTLTTNIIAKRKVARDLTDDSLSESGGVLNTVTPSRSDEPAFMYYVNDGLYGSFNCLFYDHAVVTPTLLKPPPKDAMTYSSSIWGPSCDGLDRVVEHVLLPEIDTMDWIVWNDMGAYTIAAASAFNGFHVSKVFYVISEKDFALLRGMVDSVALPGIHFSGDGCNEQKLHGKGSVMTVDVQREEIASPLNESRIHFVGGYSS